MALLTFEESLAPFSSTETRQVFRFHLLRSKRSRTSVFPPKARSLETAAADNVWSIAFEGRGDKRAGAGTGQAEQRCQSIRAEVEVQPHAVEGPFAPLTGPVKGQNGG